MQISPITSIYTKSYNQNCAKKKQTDIQKNNPSFKNIYIDYGTSLGKAAMKEDTSVFLPKDALLLNEIANQYPYQDCFIQSNNLTYPKLAYREKPPVVQQYNKTLYGAYEVLLPIYDKEYPIVPLLLTDERKSTILGLPSYISKNPSLPYTVQAGYELHKRLIKKKNEILNMIGKTDKNRYDIGEKSVIERAKKEIEPVEIAVERLLLEEAYVALANKATSQQLYESDMPKFQSRLEAKREANLTTSNAKLPKFDKEVGLENKDICEIAVSRYPNTVENKKRIEDIVRTMIEKRLNLIIS